MIIIRMMIRMVVGIINMIENARNRKENSLFLGCLICMHSFYLSSFTDEAPDRQGHFAWLHLLIQDEDIFRRQISRKLNH